MPTVVYKNAKLEINGVDLSAYARMLRLNYNAVSLDETAFGMDSSKKKGGLKEWSIDADFILQSGSNLPETVLFGLVGCQACVEVRPQNICSSANNPKYSGTVLVQSFPPMGGAVGDLLVATVKMECASDLSRASSS